MAVTNQKSDQLANADKVPAVRNLPQDVSGKLRIGRFTFTQSGAGDANSTVALAKLPPGRVRVIAALSRIANSAFGAARTLDIGHQAYTGFDGQQVSADEDAIDAAQDVSGAGNYSPTGTLGDDETILFESQDGVVLEAKVKGGTIPNGATLKGYFLYVTE